MQADITHWKLAGGTEVEVLNVIDDLSRFPGGQRRREGVQGYSTFDGVTIPNVNRGGWFYGTDRWNEGEFFRSEITDHHLVTGVSR